MRAKLRDLSERLGPGTLRDILLVNLAVGIVGVSYGAITVGDGLPLWAPNLMSIVVLGGASQFLFTGIIASGGSPVAAVLAGLLVNARHLPFGFALADTVRSRPLLGSYLMIDEVVAFALSERDRERRRLVFFTCGIALWIFWNIGSLLGGLLGNAIENTDAFGLDAAFPAVLIALVMPGLRDRRTRIVAVIGAVVAICVTPFVPTGVAVLFALAALVLMPVLRSPDPESPGDGGPAASGPHHSAPDAPGGGAR